MAIKALENLNTEIHGIIDSSDDRLPKSWIVQEIMRSHGESFADDFGRACGYEAVEKRVRHVLNRMKEDPQAAAEPDPQTVLPGFERLQKRYCVMCDGEPTVVPTHLIDDESLLERAEELRRMAAGCNKHADEIVAYVNERRAAE